MASTENERNGASRLDGWKEISGYLRCDVRTCLRWEKDLGLPIIRVNKESKRSKVIAYRADIDRWLAGGKKLESAAALPERRITPLAKIGLASAAVLILTGVVYLLLIARPVSGPAYFKLKGQTLVFFDTGDKRLWDIGIDSALEQERFYFDPPAVDNQGNIIKKWDRSKIALADIDRDGKKEVACFLNHEDPLKRSLALIDHNGHKLWENPLEYEEKYLKANPVHDFRLYQVEFEDINADGIPEILSLWHHDRDFPAVFEIHSITGKKLFQYDHTGILQFFVVNHDPGSLVAREILLGGTNNLLGGDAVLVILDCAYLKSGLGPPYAVPADLHSRAGELETFVPAAAQRAAQKYYFRFRRNELSNAQEVKWSHVTEISASPGCLMIQFQYGLQYFRFDADYHLILVSLGADSERAYQDFFIRKKVSLTQEAFLKAAEKDVLAWNGEGWIPVPKASR